MKEKIKVTFDDGRQIVVPYKTSAIDAVKMVEDKTDDILAFVINNEVKFQQYQLVTDSTIHYGQINLGKTRYAINKFKYIVFKCLVNNHEQLFKFPTNSLN